MFNLVRKPKPQNSEARPKNIAMSRSRGYLDYTQQPSGLRQKIEIFVYGLQDNKELMN